MKEMNIILAGVGGQGTILASKVLADVAMLEGYDVKISEIHGMAQRGGSVITHVKFADKVYSPLIENKKADFIVAFELLEAMRRMHFLKDNGEIIVNEQEIEPMTVITGNAEYPQEILSNLEKVAKITPINALEIAKELGNVKVVNIIMLGYLASKMKVSIENWHKAMKNQIKEKYVDLNLKAFEIGYNIE
ncbi:MAG: indolepyruvate oxidoreductase subunit beta [Clostridia bacterium]